MLSSYFPFHDIGFRCNPFRALTEEEWAEVAVLPEELTTVLDENNTHIQIIGNDGHGKTTTLLGLTAYFSRKGKRFAYEYLAHGQSKYNTDIQNLEIFLLDEFQRLSERQRVSLIASASVSPIDGLQLIVSSHQDFSNSFKACDLPLTTIPLEKISAHRLRIILDRRLSFFALDESANPSFTIDAVEYLWKTYGGDLRSVEHVLYHVFQILIPCENITEEHLQNTGLLINHDGEL
jgi:hypothetical protein